MLSVAMTGRIHERTRPISKTLSKSLAPAGPSIHEALDEGVLGGLAEGDIVPLIRISWHQRRIAMPVSSVPLSETHMTGRSRQAMIASSSRATRRPGSEVSATTARHSWVKSSTNARMRKRPPSPKASDRKSRLQRWFGPCGIAIDTRAERPFAPAAAAHDGGITVTAVGVGDGSPNIFKLTSLLWGGYGLYICTVFQASPT